MITQQVKRSAATFIFCLLLLLSTCLNLDIFVNEKILSKWYGFVSFSFLSAAFVSIRPYRCVTIDKLSTCLILLLGYMVIRGCISGMPIIDVSIYIGILALYLFFQVDFNSNRIIEILFLMCCLIQIVYVTLQYAMIIPTHHKFVILGSYGNPSGLATNLAVIFPLIFMFSKQDKIISVIFASVVLVTVILSESRTGLIAIVLVSAIYFYNNFPTRFHFYKKHIPFLLLFLGAALSIFLFLIKEDSAIGRTLIWQVTSNLILDNLIFGGGTYIFSRDYMQYQADYFSQNNLSQYTMIADNIMYAFNEYLLFFARYGLVGILLLLYGCNVLIKSRSLSSPYMLCLISIGTLSLFSYPFQYPVTWLVTVYSLVQISKTNKPLFRFTLPVNYSRFILCLFLLVGVFFFIKDIRFEYKWNKIAKASLSGQTEDMIPDYDMLYNEWNGNFLFLYNYAAELNQINHWQKSIEILNTTIQYWNEYDIQLLYADNYIRLNQWSEAET